tara:strand:+ start:160 stop:1011 length:852 start_codon:yes stop_codon:yes gene_type:complete
LCRHNRQKSRCKECEGSSICEHNRIRSQCKDCGGSQICPHNREKYNCKECGGASICSHNRRKAECKECGGSQICPHNRRKYNCKECGGSAICSHNHIRSTCKECNGSQICQHNRIKYSCKECNGSQICEHNRQKSRCYECGGSAICPHNRRKTQCKECDLPLYLVNLQRQQIRRCFSSSTLVKEQKSIEYLGCSIDFFIQYFQNKMDIANVDKEEKMTFDNIHIDHIKPVSMFDLNNKEEFLKCCHYTNLQPLLAKDNLEKSNTWDITDEIEWNTKLMEDLFI